MLDQPYSLSKTKAIDIKNTCVVLNQNALQPFQIWSSLLDFKEAAIVHHGEIASCQQSELWRAGSAQLKQETTLIENKSTCRVI